MFFSTTSSLLGLASVSYYANTGAASWDIYWSSRYYLIISSATCVFAIVQVIIGVVAGIYSCLACGGDTQSEQVGPEKMMSWLALRIQIFFLYQSRVEILTKLRSASFFAGFPPVFREHRRARNASDRWRSAKGQGKGRRKRGGRCLSRFLLPAFLCAQINIDRKRSGNEPAK